MSLRFVSVLVATILVSGSSLRADVSLPALFGDHMVLQAGRKIPVWGKAAPGEKVTVTLGKTSVDATADAAGKWKVELPARDSHPDGMTLTVVGKTTRTFTDVIVGDVWICSGQSNMQFPMDETATVATELPKANDPLLRVFRVTQATAMDPLDDVAGQWQLCTPKSIQHFTAAGYFFGRDLRRHLDRPIGLIGTYWGGTAAQAWTSLDGLRKDPELKSYVDFEERWRADLPKNQADFPAKQAAFQNAVAEWTKKYGATFTPVLEAWRKARAAAIAANQAEPPQPQPPEPIPLPPVPPEGNQGSPGHLYNAMVAPLIPYAIKGVIWYQGESNAGRAVEYRTLFGRMIKDWRERWNEGDFPFLFVQLASYKANPLVQNWPFLRESQFQTLAVPNTGMATAVDVGNPGNIHPKDKLDVGQRLALVARHVAYGEKLVYSGPIYDAMKANGDSIHLTFTHTGGGLMIGSAPWVPPGYPPLATDKLLGFTIAGADKNFVPADAKIVGDTVVVSSAQVTAPVAVRYDWANAPQGNLYNAEKLPALPFRTDDWIDPVAMGLPKTAGK